MALDLLKIIVSFSVLTQPSEIMIVLENGKADRTLQICVASFCGVCFVDIIL